MSLQKVVEGFIAKSVFANNEQFGNPQTPEELYLVQSQQSTASALSFLIVTIAMYLILMLIGKWLWNTVVVQMITIAKPIDSVFYLIGFAILVKLVIY
jgi:hypothetical protein